MTTLSASFRLRPTRIGFLVRPNDIASVRQVAQACTCSWGGIYNPVVPVCTELPDAWRDPPFRELTSLNLRTATSGSLNRMFSSKHRKALLRRLERRKASSDTASRAQYRSACFQIPTGIVCRGHLERTLFMPIELPPRKARPIDLTKRCRRSLVGHLVR
jgi:hypothetical protein